MFFTVNVEWPVMESTGFLVPATMKSISEGTIYEKQNTDL